MRSRLLIALLLLVPVAGFAQDQTLPPTSDLVDSAAMFNSTSTCATACSTTDCAAAIDELPSIDGVTVTAIATTGDRTMRVTFDTPSSDPSATADAQTMDIRISRCVVACTEATGGTNPTATAEVYCNGSLHQTLYTAVAITGLDQDQSTTWTHGGACATDGSDVELRLTVLHAGGGGNRRWSCIEAVEWEVTHATAGRSRRFMSLKGIMGMFHR